MTYPFPKSFCTCGHQGDGPDSHHAGLIGHGRCVVPDCTCVKFTWARWTQLFERTYMRAIANMPPRITSANRS